MTDECCINAGGSFHGQYCMNNIRPYESKLQPATITILFSMIDIFFNPVHVIFFPLDRYGHLSTSKTNYPVGEIAYSNISMSYLWR
jgi:hypothetical protein